MNKIIITPAESDEFLVDFSDWISLTDTEKERHIAKGSVYVQVIWNCVDVDWLDDGTISETIKEAVAYYSYADFHGNLYGDITQEEENKGNLRSVKDKVGSLESEQSWYRGGKGTPSGPKKSHGYPDGLMQTECERNTSTSFLTRV